MDRNEIETLNLQEVFPDLSPEEIHARWNVLMFTRVRELPPSNGISDEMRQGVMGEWTVRELLESADN